MAVLAAAQCTLSVAVDVASVDTYYRLQPSTAAAPAKPASASPSEWSATEPAYEAGATSTLYTCAKTTLTDGTYCWSAVSKSTSYEAAKQAYNEAQAAKRTATAFVTELSDGIMVHPEGDDTTGWSIRDALELLKSGVSWLKMWVEGAAAKVRIGKKDDSHVLIQSGKISMTDSEGYEAFAVSEDGTTSVRTTILDSDELDFTKGLSAALANEPVEKTKIFLSVLSAEYFKGSSPYSETETVVFTAGSLDTYAVYSGVVVYDGDRTFYLEYKSSDGDLSYTIDIDYVSYTAIIERPAPTIRLAENDLLPTFMAHSKPAEAYVPVRPCIVVCNDGSAWLYTDD